MMKKIVKILCLAMLGVMVMGLSSCSGKADPDKVLRVGMECAYAPFNWTQVGGANDAVKLSDGTYAGGYDVEIAKRIAESMGRELVVVKTDWDGLAPSLTSGKIDAIIAGMSATDDRKQTIDFSDNYYYSDLVVVVQKDGAYANAAALSDFAGAKITAQLNTLHYDVVDQMAGVQKQTALEDFPTMIIALTSGKIDGYVSERPGALSAVAANPKLTFIDFVPGTGFDFSGDEVSIAVGVAKNSPLTAEINDALAKISEDERVRIMDEAVRNQPLGQ